MPETNGIDRRRFVRTVGATGIGASIAGCLGGGGGGSNSNGSDSEGTTLQMSLLTSTPKKAVQQFESMLHEAGLSKDISIDISVKSPGTLEDQYRQWLNAGRSSPALLLMDVGWSIPFIRRGQLLNLNKHFSKDRIQTLENDYNDASVDSSRGQKGNIFGVPFIFDIRGTLYRRDLAKKAGYDPGGQNWETELKSWEKFSQVVADVQKQQQGLDYGLTMPFKLSQTITCCTFNSLMSQWGGAYFGGRDYLFGPVGERPITVDEERVLDALRMIRTFIWGHDDKHSLDNSSFAGQIIPPGALGWRYTKDLDSFLNGNTFAYSVGTPGVVVLGALEKHFGDKVNEKVGLMPKPYGIKEAESEYQGIGGTATPLAGYNLSVNPYSNKQKREAALEVLRVTMTDEFLIQWFNVSGNLPAKPALMKSDELRSHPTLGEYMDTFSVMADNAIPRPVTPIYFQESKVIAQEVHNAVAQDEAPEKAMADLKQQLHEIEESFDNGQ